MNNALSYTKKLEQAGFPRKQAEEVVQTMYGLVDREYYDKVKLIGNEVSSQLKETFVTKEELRDLRNELKAEIGGLRNEVDFIKKAIAEIYLKIERSEKRLIYWMISLSGLMTFILGYFSRVK